MPISVMIKPSSSACNLRCEYCFYSSLSEGRSDYSKGFMKPETAENIIKSAVEFTKGTRIIFTFQGGEPMLSGLEFFKDFVEMVNKHNVYHSQIIYCLQTNATLITDEWCAFFKKNDFLIGVSLDGNAQQNSYRVYADGRPSFDDVMKGVKLLQQYGVEFNILSVVTKKLANSVRDNYRFLKQNGIADIQYINCLKPFEGEYNGDIYMNADDYAQFLEKAFKLYYNDNMRGNRVSVRSFDNYLLLSQGKNAEQCGMNGFCSVQFVVEGDGTVYPCDFYCTDEWELGNINEKSFAQMHEGKKAKDFIEDSFYIAEKCKWCDYFALCRGCGCKRSREDGDFCPSYKKFFSLYKDKIREMRRFIR